MATPMPTATPTAEAAPVAAPAAEAAKPAAKDDLATALADDFDPEAEARAKAEADKEGEKEGRAGAEGAGFFGRILGMAAWVVDAVAGLVAPRRRSPPPRVALIREVSRQDQGLTADEVTFYRLAIQDGYLDMDQVQEARAEVAKGREEAKRVRGKRPDEVPNFYQVLIRKGLINARTVSTLATRLAAGERPVAPDAKPVPAALAEEDEYCLAQDEIRFYRHAVNEKILSVRDAKTALRLLDRRQRDGIPTNLYKIVLDMGAMDPDRFRMILTKCASGKTPELNIGKETEEQALQRKMAEAKADQEREKEKAKPKTREEKLLAKDEYKFYRLALHYGYLTQEQVTAALDQVEERRAAVAKAGEGGEGGEGTNLYRALLEKESISMDALRLLLAKVIAGEEPPSDEAKGPDPEDAMLSQEELALFSKDELKFYKRAYNTENMTYRKARRCLKLLKERRAENYPTNFYKVVRELEVLDPETFRTVLQGSLLSEGREIALGRKAPPCQETAEEAGLLKKAAPKPKAEESLPEELRVLTPDELKFYRVAVKTKVITEEQFKDCLASLRERRQDKKEQTSLFTVATETGAARASTFGKVFAELFSGVGADEIDLENAGGNVTDRLSKVAAKKKDGGGAKITMKEKKDVTGVKLGQYEIVSELGRGAMGVVYEAFDTMLSRRVALKVLPADIAENERAVRRFKREAANSARIRHENVINVFGTGEDGGTYFYAMEVVEGRGLDEIIAAERVTFKRAANLIRQGSLGLNAAHVLNIIHRDVKPANMMVMADDSLKVADFGLAKDTTAQQSMSMAGELIGTPAYMAPEQATGGELGTIDAYSDQYSLGVCLYELLTLEKPFFANDLATTISKIVNEDPIPPSQKAQNIPKDLENIALKAMEKEKHRRYASCQELAEDLQRFLDDEPVKARPLGFIGKRVRWYKKNWKMATPVACMILAALIGLGIFVNNKLEAARLRRLEIAGIKTRMDELVAQGDDILQKQVREAQNVAGTRKDEAVALRTDPTAAAVFQEAFAGLNEAERLCNEALKTYEDCGRLFQEQFRVELQDHESYKLAETREGETKEELNRVKAAQDKLREAINAYDQEMGKKGDAEGIARTAQKFYDTARLYLVLGRRDEGKKLLVDAIAKADNSLNTYKNDLAYQVKFNAAVRRFEEGITDNAFDLSALMMGSVQGTELNPPAMERDDPPRWVVDLEEPALDEAGAQESVDGQPVSSPRELPVHTDPARPETLLGPDGEPLCLAELDRPAWRRTEAGAWEPDPSRKPLVRARPREGEDKAWETLAGEPVAAEAVEAGSRRLRRVERSVDVIDMDVLLTEKGRKIKIDPEGNAIDPKEKGIFLTRPGRVQVLPGAEGYIDLNRREPVLAVRRQVTDYRKEKDPATQKDRWVPVLDLETGTPLSREAWVRVIPDGRGGYLDNDPNGNPVEETPVRLDEQVYAQTTLVYLEDKLAWAKENKEAYDKAVQNGKEYIAQSKWSLARLELDFAKEILNTQELEGLYRESAYGEEREKGEEAKRRGSKDALEQAKAHFDKAMTYTEVPQARKELNSLITECNEAIVREIVSEARLRFGEGNWVECIARTEAALAIIPTDREARYYRREATYNKVKREDSVYVSVFGVEGARTYTVGSREMDDNNKMHDVTPTRSFYLCRFEVTNREYLEFVTDQGYAAAAPWWDEGARPYLDPGRADAFVVNLEKEGEERRMGPLGWTDDRVPVAGKEGHPVTGLSWYEARAYCRWRTAKRGDPVRLPTWAEWEIAARVDPKTQNISSKFPWGESFTNMDSFKSSTVDATAPHADVSLTGCYHLGGNAFEWTDGADLVFSDKPEDDLNPVRAQGAVTVLREMALAPVLRGGSCGWNNVALAERYARAAKVFIPHPSHRTDKTGLRLTRDVAEGEL
ncbi:MAG: protein kinase [Planctomycetes bacterium]|nr:protein kinase [Planctomycetota bacterium]